jgi:hypothetical protein
MQSHGSSTQSKLNEIPEFSPKPRFDIYALRFIFVKPRLTNNYFVFADTL